MLDTEQVEQRTEEWKACRLGRVTASRLADVVAKTKSGWGASRANYLAQLVAERLSGVPAEGYTNAAMKFGTETEPLARQAYEARFQQKVDEVGFVEHPFIKMTGASPDGLVNGDGLIEIKCPNTATHIDTLLGESVGNKYLLQMQWQMNCTGRKWCDFVSFDPRMPEKLKLKVIRVERDDKLIEELEKNVIDFLAEVDAKEAALRGLMQ